MITISQMQPLLESLSRAMPVLLDSMLKATVVLGVAWLIYRDCGARPPPGATWSGSPA